MPAPWNRKSARTIAPKFAVTDLGGGEAEIVMYGDVVEEEPRDWWTGEPTGEQAISAERFNRELEAIRGARHITVRLNSCGGDAYTGVAIYSALRGLDAGITVRIEGIAASAASAIACAGDNVIVSPGSIFMVHEARVGLMGYYSRGDLDAIAKDIEATNRSLLNIYEAKCKRPTDELERMMADETWMVGQEIIDAGFADEMEGDGEAVEAGASGEFMVAGIWHDLSGYRNVPKDLAARVAASEMGPSAHAVADMKEPPKAAEEKGVMNMTLDELRAQCPELVAEIESAAVEAERDRIAQIDEIAGGIPAEMVASAKYGEPCTAQELAYRAMCAASASNKAQAHKEAAAAAEFRAALETDASESGAASVSCAPNGGIDKDDEVASAQATIAKMAGVFASMKKGE